MQYSKPNSSHVRSRDFSNSLSCVTTLSSVASSTNSTALASVTPQSPNVFFSSNFSPPHTNLCSGNAISCAADRVPGAQVGVRRREVGREEDVGRLRCHGSKRGGVRAGGDGGQRRDAAQGVAEVARPHVRRVGLALLLQARR